MQESTTCSIPFPVTSHHMVDAGPRNPNPSSNIPYTSSIPNMNGMIPQVNGHRMNNRRFSTGSHLSTLFESNNEHTLNTANISNNCSDMSAESSTGNVIGGMVGVRNNSFNSSGPRYSLEMLIAALDTPTEVKHENQSPQEAGFAATYGNGHLRQEIQPQSEHWAPLSTTFGTSADNVWRPWNPSGEYLANPEPEFTQRMEYGMSFQGTLGYNGNANFARAPTFCGQSSSAGSLENNDNRGSAYIKQEDAMTLEALKGFEMVNLNWMQQSQLGEQLMPDNVTRLDASVIQSPPESAFYSQRPNSAQALQNQMRQQQLCQYGNTQSIYGHQTPPTTKLHTPPPPGGMQPYVHAPQSVKFGLSRKRSVPNNESHLALDINNGSGTLSAAEEDMMMRKRSKSFDIAMILSNQGGIPSRSSGQFLETSAFRDQATQASPRYLGQLAYKIESLRAPHGRAITTSLITESNHGMGADSSSSLDYHGNVHTPHPMFDPQTLAIAAHMKNPPPAQCGENIPSVPDLVEETDDDESCPRRQRARYPGDLYTPQWVRYVGQSKQGFCDTCSPGKWLQLKNSAYWYHKQFFHGISSVSGKTFLNPLDQRVVEQDVVEGLCHQCNQWIPISNSKRRNCVLWYRHAHKCHIYHKPKNAVGMQKQS